MEYRSTMAYRRRCSNLHNLQLTCERLLWHKHIQIQIKQQHPARHPDWKWSQRRGNDYFSAKCCYYHWRNQLILISRQDDVWELLISLAYYGILKLCTNVNVIYLPTQHQRAVGVRFVQRCQCVSGLLPTPEKGRGSWTTMSKCHRVMLLSPEMCALQHTT